MALINVSQSLRLQIAFSCLWLFGQCLHNEARAEDTVAVSTPVSSAYCGIHCVYAAVRLQRADTSFDTLLDKRFLTGRYGSTGDDLIRAFSSFGVSARFDSSISLEELEAHPGPAILHVRTVGSRVYSHWVLYLGCKDGLIQIYDPPAALMSFSKTDLLSVWSSAAVIPEVKAARNQGSGSLQSFIPASISCIGMIVLSFVMLGLLRNVSAFTTLSVVVLALTAFAHLASATGFRNGASGISIVQCAYFPREASEIDAETVERALSRSDVILVDARRSTAYGRFHLPGAINIPIDSTHAQFMNSIEQLKGAQSIIVYCQSDECHWADSIANQLLYRGFDDVQIYRGGVREWQRRNEP